MPDGSELPDDYGENNPRELTREEYEALYDISNATLIRATNTFTFYVSGSSSEWPCYTGSNTATVTIGGTSQTLTSNTFLTYNYQSCTLSISDDIYYYIYDTDATAASLDDSHKQKIVSYVDGYELRGFVLCAPWGYTDSYTIYTGCYGSDINDNASGSYISLYYVEETSSTPEVASVILSSPNTSIVRLNSSGDSYIQLYMTVGSVIDLSTYTSDLVVSSGYEFMGWSLYTYYDSSHTIYTSSYTVTSSEVFLYPVCRATSSGSGSGSSNLDDTNWKMINLINYTWTNFYATFSQFCTEASIGGITIMSILVSAVIIMLVVFLFRFVTRGS